MSENDSTVRTENKTKQYKPDSLYMYIYIYINGCKKGRNNIQNFFKHIFTYV